MAETNHAPTPEQNVRTAESQPNQEPTQNDAPLPTNDEEARERNAVGTLKQPEGSEANVPPAMSPIGTGAPD